MYTNKPYATPLTRMHWATGTSPGLPQTSGSMIPIIGAGLSAVSGIANAIGARRREKRNYRNQLEFWRMNNEYNHPSAQMQRLKDAGLNPNLIYGQSAQGATGSSGAPPKAPQTEALRIEGNPITEYQNIKSTQLQTDNLRQQNTLLKQQQLTQMINNLKTVSETKGIDIRNSKLPQQLQLEIEGQISANRIKSNEGILSDYERNFVQENFGLYERALKSKYMQGIKDLDLKEQLLRLRKVEADMKEDLAKFTNTNQFVNILAKIAGLKIW